MLLASCSKDIKFLKWPSGDNHATFKIPDAGFFVPSISWCCEGAFLVTTVPSLGSPIVISVGDTGVQTYHVIEVAQVQSIAFSKTIQKNVALGTEIGNVFIYDINLKSLVQRLPILPSGVKFLQYGAQDIFLAAGCKSGQICLYNSKFDVSETFYVPDSGGLSAMSCHPQLPNILAGANSDGIVVVWDSSSRNAAYLNKTHEGTVTDVAFSSENSMGTVGLDQQFIGYDLRAKECSFCCKTEEPLSSVAFMPGGDEKIAVASMDGKLFCYDKRSINHPIHTIVAHHPKSIGRIAFQNIPSHEQRPIIDNELLRHQTYNSNIVSKTIQEDMHELVEKTSLPPSTINSIMTDSESECLVPNSCEFAAYLENLECSRTIHNRGDVAANRLMVGRDGLTLNRPRATQSVHEVESSNSHLSRLRCAMNNDSVKSNKSTLQQESIENLGDFNNDVLHNWIDKLPLSPSGSSSLASMNHSNDIVKLKNDVQDASKEMIEQLAELLNKEFLRVRMAVSRGFIQMEGKMNGRWTEFHLALMKMAGYEVGTDDGNEQEHLARQSGESGEKVTHSSKKTSKSHFSKTI